MTGVERNADVVVLASYAPLFARVGYAQWSPDMIWFDETKAYGTPSYFVQKLTEKYGNRDPCDGRTGKRAAQGAGLCKIILYTNPLLRNYNIICIALKSYSRRKDVCL